MLLPSWQLVATTHAFKKEGSFVSRELFGRPLWLRKEKGEFTDS
jgi:hypothetical protein